MLFRKTLSLALLLALPYAPDLFGQEADERTAPWDYRDPRHATDLAIIEKNHFNVDIQTLTRGQTGAFPGGDLEFILRYFPNHHHALNLMSTLWLTDRESGTGAPSGLAPGRNAEFHFRRAIEFAPDDGIVRMLYGNYLLQDQQAERAVSEFEAALLLEPSSPEVHYNAGLCHFTLGDYENALKHAEIAYRSGYPLPGLRRKLIEVGAWDDSLD